MNGATDMQCGSLAFLEPCDIAEEELEPTLQEGIEPGGRHLLLQMADDFSRRWRGHFWRCSNGSAHVRAGCRLHRRCPLGLLPVFSSNSSMSCEACILSS